MTNTKNNYEITKRGQVLIIAGVLIFVCLLFVFFAYNKDNKNDQANTGNTRNKTRIQKNRFVSNANENKNVNNQINKKSNYTDKNHNRTNTNLPKKKKVIRYKEPAEKSIYSRKHHDMKVVKNTNYSQMVPFKTGENPQEQWVINYIKKFKKALPRTIMPDYGDRGYYVNILGKDKKGRQIIPGINPKGQWSTLFYTNASTKTGIAKLELGHNWEYWQRRGYKVNAFYTASKTISLRNQQGKNLVSSMYPVNQSMSKGAAYNFK